MNSIHRASATAAAAALLILVGVLARAQSQPRRGKVVYDAHCVECHGPAGQGDGPADAQIKPRPRDFTSGKYKIRSTDTGSVPADEDVVRSVRQGLSGTAMPAWEKILSDVDIADVAAYVRTLSPRFTSEQPKPVTIGARVPASPASVARGRQAPRACRGSPIPRHAPWLHADGTSR